MDLRDVTDNASDQDRGAWFEALDPVTGERTGLRFLVTGPDSKTQARARLALVEELAELADIDGNVTAENRETVRLNQLARAVIGWEVNSDGAPLRFGHGAMLRVLRAGVWLQAQIDARAADRRPFPIGARVWGE